MDDRLWLYQWLERLGWPRSYLGKIIFVACLATYLPLLVLLAYLVFAPTNTSRLTTAWLVLLATSVGTVLFGLASYQLLKPMLLAARALSTYLDEGKVLKVPTRFHDEVGLLLGNVAQAVQTFERRQRTLEQLASEDFLTRLPNRRAAEDRLRQSLKLAARDQLSLCVALMDIDRFKQINDQHGHTVGDQVLRRLSRHLRQTLRGSDWAARWGGEEFLIVLFSEAAGARTALERVRTSLGKLRITAGYTEVKFTVSVGFTRATADTQLQDCVEQADAALYQAKQAGRNCVYLYQH